MSTTAISEAEIVEALHRIPANRWPEVMDYLRHLQPQSPSDLNAPIRTAQDILNSGMIGIWADRTDISDNHEFARELRRRAEQGLDDATGQ